MNERRNRLRAGIFTALTLLLFLVMMFYFGLSQVFVRKAAVVTCFAESVQGLSAGSEVMYRGVKVGSVKSIRILPDAKLILVNMDIELDKFEPGDSEYSETKFYQFLRREMGQGLRCRLEFVGITGMKNVSLDYYETPENKLPETPTAARRAECVYVPAVSSSFKDIMVALTRAMDKISQVRFEDISSQVEGVLKELNSTLAAPELKATLQHVKQLTSHLANTTDALSKVLNEKRMDELVSNVNNSVSAVNVLVKQLTEVSERMKLPETAAGIREVSDAALNTRQEFVATIGKLNEALDALRQLCELMSNEPGFLLGNGKRTE